MPAITILPDLLQTLNQQRQDLSILNDFRSERWVGLSAADVTNSVYFLALALREMGLKEGDTVGIYAPSSSQWLMMDLAVLLAGGITVPIFANISHAGLEYIIEDAQLKMIFIEGEETIKEIRPLLSRFQHVLLDDPNQQGENIRQIKELRQKGEALFQVDASSVEKLKKLIKPNDLATYIYTSGSTGKPKGVELTHHNLVSQILAAAERFPISAEKDVALSCLPLAHIFERMVVYFYFSRNVPIYFADDVKNLASLLPKVKPTLLTVVPRLLEKVQLGITTKARAGSWFKKTLALKAFKRASEKDPAEPLSFMDNLYHRLVYRKIKSALGGRLTYVISGGSALSSDLCRFFLNMGIPIFQGYGMTECSPVVAASFPGANREGYVGKPFPEVSVKISEAGEILVKGPGVMRGYHLKPEATAEVIDREGWFHTGDKGEFNEDGLLRITGRIKEIFKTSTGKYVSPAKVEQKLVGYYLIDMAMVIGENRKFVSSLIFLDPLHVKKLKEKSEKAHLSDAEYIEQEGIRSKIEHFIKGMNKSLDHWEQVQKFSIVADVLSIEDGSLTPTMKIRRHVVLERYRELIDKMYEEKQN